MFRRAFLRSVLAAVVGCGPRELVFAQGEHGKPSLAGLADAPCFSLSRSGAWVLVGVTRGRALGVDLEQDDPRLAQAEELSRLAERVLCARERDELARLPAGARTAAFLRAWTRKEAWLKATGTGLAREPDTLDVGLEARRTPRSLRAPDFPGGAHMLDLAAPRGWTACLVVAGELGPIVDSRHASLGSSAC